MEDSHHCLGDFLSRAILRLFLIRTLSNYQFGPNRQCVSFAKSANALPLESIKVDVYIRGTLDLNNEKPSDAERPELTYHILVKTGNLKKASNDFSDIYLKLHGLLNFHKMILILYRNQRKQ